MPIWLDDTKQRQCGLGSLFSSLALQFSRKNLSLQPCFPLNPPLSVLRDLRSSSSSCFIATSRALCCLSSVMFFHLWGWAVRGSYFPHLFLSLFCICRIPEASCGAIIYCRCSLSRFASSYCLRCCSLQKGRQPWWTTSFLTDGPLSFIFKSSSHAGIICWINYFTNAFSRTFFLSCVASCKMAPLKVNL